MAIGLAAFGFLLTLDGSGVDPDGLIGLGGLLAAAAAVGLGFAAQVARPRFFLLGVALAEATYFGVWLAVVPSDRPSL